MSLTAPPARGYADWQRVDNWDSGTLYTDRGVLIPPGLSTPALDVSRYAYLAGYDTVGAANASAQIVWYSDPALTLQLGLRTFTLSTFMPVAAQYRLPNLGPFAQITYNVAGAGGPVHSSTIFGTNRYHPLEFIPSNPVLLDLQNVALGANATLTNYPTDYYAGPMNVYVRSSQAGNVYLQSLTPAGNWDRIDKRVLAAAIDNTFLMIAPPGAWRLLVDNSTLNAATVYFTATPSMSGAA